MNRTYVIADLHGRFDLLLEATKAISRHSAGQPHKVVTLGDYVDRGPESSNVIMYLMAAQGDGAPLICLKGNHEDIMVQTLTKGLKPDWWIGNGGSKTLYSYDHPKMRGGAVGKEYRPWQPGVVPVEHLTWLASLPLMHVDQHRVYVHAGVAPDTPLDEQNEERVMWMLWPHEVDVGHRDRHVVHGHHSSRKGPILLKHRTNLDTEAYSTGRLVIGVFDDEVPGGPVDTIEIKGAPAP